MQANLDPSEIKPGLVLHLDPDTLVRHGATCSCDANRRVTGHHFFICIARDDDESRWLPLYSGDGPGRTLLHTESRTGHTKFTSGLFYLHKDQVWTGTSDSIIAAAGAGNDQSTAGYRNLLAEERVPRLITGELFGGVEQHSVN